MADHSHGDPLAGRPGIVAYGPRVPGFHIHADGDLRSLADVHLKN